jgi:MoaA/NifB/PqqE/SkfB family radical SAM enzyme
METDPRCLMKFVCNAGWGGVRSVQKFKRRIRRGEYFPPFIYFSITSACNLRCRGCWADVDQPPQHLPAEDLDRVICQSKRHGNRFFGILGGEPLLHPDLLEVLGHHTDCYFQLFTNGHLLTDRLAADFRRLANITPLVSIEGSTTVSDERRGGQNVLDKTLAGLQHCSRHGLLTGVATSLCRNNIDDLLTDIWIERLIELGVHYVWFYTYRPVGPDPAPELALTEEQIVAARRFNLDIRNRYPIGVIDAYWDDRGQALCPAAVGVSHHIGPAGDIEPCPVIQLAIDTIHSGDGIYDTIARSPFLGDFRRTAAATSRGCIMLERPDLLKELAERHNAKDTTTRGTVLAELNAMTPRSSQHLPGRELPEENLWYRFAKKRWFFGFGAYT